MKGILFDISIYINTEYRLKEFGGLSGSPVDDLLSIPARMSADAGYVRDLCGRFDGLGTQYTLRPTNPGEAARTVNGALRAIYVDDFFPRSFPHGHFEKLPTELFETLGWQALPELPFIHTFFADRMEPIDIHYPILQSYLDTCLKGIWNMARSSPSSS